MQRYICIDSRLGLLIGKLVPPLGFPLNVYPLILCIIKSFSPLKYLKNLMASAKPQSRKAAKPQSRTICSLARVVLQFFQVYYYTILRNPKKLCNNGDVLVLLLGLIILCSRPSWGYTRWYTVERIITPRIRGLQADKSTGATRCCKQKRTKARRSVLQYWILTDSNCTLLIKHSRIN